MLRSTCKLKSEPKGIKYVQFLEEDLVHEEVLSFYSVGQISKNPDLVISRYTNFSNLEGEQMTYLSPAKGTDAFETTNGITNKFVTIGVNCYFGISYLLKSGPIYSKLNVIEQLAN